MSDKDIKVEEKMIEWWEIDCPIRQKAKDFDGENINNCLFSKCPYYSKGNCPYNKITKYYEQQLQRKEDENKQLREALTHFTNLTSYLYRVDFLKTKMEVIEHFNNVFNEFENIAKEALK